MQKLIWLLAACALLACSEGKSASASKPHAGEESDANDAPGEPGGLERAPGSLPRSAKKLPDDLKPPGYGR